MHDELVSGERALRAGANGDLVKQEAPENAIIAIRKVRSGERYLSERTQSLITQKIRGWPAYQPVSVISSPTDCEHEIFRMKPMGFRSSEIAVKMNRSVRTVETHRGNMKKKRGLRNAYELNRFAATFVEKERT